MAACEAEKDSDEEGKEAKEDKVDVKPQVMMLKRCAKCQSAVKKYATHAKTQK